MMPQLILARYPVVLLFLLVFISGCSFNSSNEQSTNLTNEGVIFSFIEDIPPDELFLFDNTNFEVGLSVENKGSSSSNPFLTIKAETLLLKFCEQNIQSCNARQITLDVGELNGNSEFVIGGQKSTFFDVRYNQLASPFESATLTASLCYDYATKLTIPVVFDLDSPSNSEVFTFTSQGAPVVINQVRVNTGVRNFLTVPSETERGRSRTGESSEFVPTFLFTITLANAGDGEVPFISSIITDSENFQELQPEDQRTHRGQRNNLEHIEDFSRVCNPAESSKYKAVIGKDEPIRGFFPRVSLDGQSLYCNQTRQLQEISPEGETMINIKNYRDNEDNPARTFSFDFFEPDTSFTCQFCPEGCQPTRDNVCVKIDNDDKTEVCSASEHPYTLGDEHTALLDIVIDYAYTSVATKEIIFRKS